MTRVLGDSGHIVATANSVKAALALAERAKFDLVISDKEAIAKASAAGNT